MNVTSNSFDRKKHNWASATMLRVYDHLFSVKTYRIVFCVNKLGNVSIDNNRCRIKYEYSKSRKSYFIFCANVNEKIDEITEIFCHLIIIFWIQIVIIIFLPVSIIFERKYTGLIKCSNRKRKQNKWLIL